MACADDDDGGNVAIIPHRTNESCTTPPALPMDRVTGIFLRHGLRLRQGYATFGPSSEDPNIYLSINISLPAEKLAQIQAEVSKIAGATIQP